MSTRLIALLLTILTGFTGLSYEVAWQKYLGILLGAHSEATAAVLGLFLGGLSLGYWLLGALTRRLMQRSKQTGEPPPLLLVYGAVEAGIGVYCILFPLIFPVVRALSVWLPTGIGALAFAVDVALAALLILPPAILMGGTIPILTQALARSLDDATRFHALVYALNTAGAFAGALASGFALIHWLGLPGVMVAMGCINIAVGAVFVVLGRRRYELVDLSAPVGGAAEAANLAWVYGFVALLLGFAMMVFQTTLIRIGGLSFGSSEFTFSIVVAVFVLCIAMGSLAVSALPAVPRWLLPASLWLLGALLAGLYFALQTGPYWAHSLRSLFRDDAAGFYPFYVAALVGIFCFIGPAVILSGASLPLLFHGLRREVEDLGDSAGRLYSMNTVGSLLGALLGGYALLFWLDLDVVYRLAVCAVAIAAAIVSQRQYAIGLPWVSAFTALLLLLVSGFTPWSPSYLMSGTFRVRTPQPWTHAGPASMPHHDYRFSYHADGPNASVAVQDVELAGSASRTLFVNGKSDGNSVGDYPTMALAALLPAAFAERAEESFVIGFGTGVTAGELAALDEAESVTVAEISHAVVDAAPLFDEWNHTASKHPKVDMVVSDAYRALLRQGRRFDVIVSEPSNPWVTGVEMLFSREFLEQARRHLKPGGVYCQWYHLYETSEAAVEMVLATYAAVFDHVAVWAVNDIDILLLGFDDDTHLMDLERLARRLEQPDFARAFGKLGIRSVEDLLVHEVLPLGVVHAARLDAAPHTLYHPRLSFEAGRAFFDGGRAFVPFLGYGQAAQRGLQNSLLARYLAASDDAPEKYRRLAVHACHAGLRICRAAVARWFRREGESPDLQTLAKFADPAGMQAVRQLAVLMNRGTTEATRRLPLERLELETRAFMQLYAHAFPFGRRTLVDHWQRCGVNEAEREACSNGLSHARALADDTPPPEPSQWTEAPAS